MDAKQSLSSPWLNCSPPLPPHHFHYSLLCIVQSGHCPSRWEPVFTLSSSSTSLFFFPGISFPLRSSLSHLYLPVWSQWGFHKCATACKHRREGTHVSKHSSRRSMRPIECRNGLKAVTIHLQSPCALTDKNLLFFIYHYLPSYFTTLSPFSLHCQVLQ